MELKQESTATLLKEFLYLATREDPNDWGTVEDGAALMLELARRIDNGNNGNHYHSYVNKIGGF